MGKLGATDGAHRHEISMGESEQKRGIPTGKAYESMGVMQENHSTPIGGYVEETMGTREHPRGTLGNHSITIE